MAQALRLAIRHLQRRRGDKVILLATDGLPDDRAATLDAARLARAQGITLIAVGTGQADEAFLAALTPKPELATEVESGQLEETMGSTLAVLPREVVQRKNVDREVAGTQNMSTIDSNRYRC